VIDHECSFIAEEIHVKSIDVMHSDDEVTKLMAEIYKRMMMIESRDRDAKIGDKRVQGQEEKVGNFRNHRR
jgi:hypothetical protein